MISRQSKNRRSALLILQDRIFSNFFIELTLTNNPSGGSEHPIFRHTQKGIRK